MKGVIDLRKCKSGIKEIFFDNLVAPIKNGDHEHDFDVIMDECSPQFIERHVLRTRRNLRKKIRKGISIETEIMPIGVNLVQLPTEAILTFDT